MIDLIAGARPNFMKIAPIIRALEAMRDTPNSPTYRLIHTGQHYDHKMSGSFFDQLGIPEPDVNLNVKSGSQAEQTSAIMMGYEGVLTESAPRVCVVVGDVNSTMACAIAAKKLNVRVAHVEGGIRSGDREMPEEINRLVTDSISDLFFTTSRSASENLLKTGANAADVIFVGNTMIDTLQYNLDKLCAPEAWEKEGLSDSKYVVITLHRPSNVDDPENLARVLEVIVESCRGMKVVFPCHPRTRQVLGRARSIPSDLVLLEPLPYLEFNYLVKFASAVITDSGGVTEETTFLGIPCMTLRDTTERPETVTLGTNVLLGSDPEAVRQGMDVLLRGEWKKGQIPEKWDGRAGERIAQELKVRFF